MRYGYGKQALWCLVCGWVFLLSACSLPHAAAPAPPPSPTATALPAPTITPRPLPTVSFWLELDPTPTPTAAAATATAAVEQPTAQAVITHGGNLRAEPRIAPETVIAQVCPGDEVLLLEQQEVDGITWLYIAVAAVNGECVAERAAVADRGWISRMLVAEPAAAAAPEEQAAPLAEAPAASPPNAESAPPTAVPDTPPLLLPPPELISGTYTIDSNLKMPVTVSGAQLDEFIKAVYPESPLIGLGDIWVQAGESYRINPIYLLAHAIQVSNWGTSSIARERHNPYHWGVNAICDADCAESYEDMATGIFYVAGRINQNYLSPEGINYHTATLRGLQQGYAAQPEWASMVAGYMNWVAAFLEIEPIRSAPTAALAANDLRMVQPACFQVVQAALSSYGKPYTQAGGRRAGPDSFDCSGLVWWAYQQANITADAQGRSFGTSTYTQIFNGTRTECDLDDLNGAKTTCWAPGDLVFIRYPGGQHVSLYVGKGLFSDCYSYEMGCILHDISHNSFYHEHFWQARRVLPDCAGMIIDPETMLENPVLITWDDSTVTAPGR